MSDLSVIIVNWNVAELLTECLESVYTELISTELEVVVVDNASTDGSREMLAAAFPAARLIANDENVGFARAVNQGIQASVGRYLLVLNPDTRLPGDVYAPMRAVLERRPEVGIVAPALHDEGGTLSRGAGGSFPTLRTVLSTSTFLYKAFPRRRWARGIWLAEDEPTPRDLDWVSGACMLLRREVADELGGFDERYFLLCEDIDLCFRARKAGWLTHYLASVSVLHHEGSSFERQDEAFLLRNGASLQLYLRVHYGRVAGALLGVPLKLNYLARFVVAGLRYLLTRRPADHKRYLLVRKHFRMLS